MKRRFFTAGEAVPVIERGWPDTEQQVVVMHVLREEEIGVVNGALSLVYVELDEESKTNEQGE